MAKYVCRNYGSCTKADTREEIDLVPGAEPVCECGFELKPLETDTAGSDSTRKFAFAGGGVIALLVVAGTAYWMTMGSSPAGKSKAGSTASANSPAAGIAPSPEQLRKDKEAIDAAIKAGANNPPAADQRAVIAREFIKAAVASMQAGKWAEAQEQLDKAKAEFADEPLIYINQAILSLRQSKREEALVQVETALQKGFRSYAALEADQDLKSLTASEAYRKLIARYPVN